MVVVGRGANYIKLNISDLICISEQRFLKDYTDKDYKQRLLLVSI